MLINQIRNLIEYLNIIINKIGIIYLYVLKFALLSGFLPFDSVHPLFKTEHFFYRNFLKVL